MSSWHGLNEAWNISSLSGTYLSRGTTLPLDYNVIYSKFHFGSNQSTITPTIHEAQNQINLN